MITSPTNYATTKMLQRIPAGVRYVEFAPDMVACHPDDISIVRTALNDQPQVLYFLERGMLLTEVALNSVGAKCAVVHAPGAAPYPHGANLGAMPVSTTIATVTMGLWEPPQPTVFSDGPVLEASGWHVEEPFYNREVRRGNGAAWPVNATESYFGSTPMGQKFRYHQTQFTDPGNFDPPWAASSVATPEAAGPGGSVSDITKTIPLSGLGTPLDENVSPLKVGWIVFTGPALVDHAEFYSNGFAFVALRLPRLAAGLKALIDAAPEELGSKSDAVAKLAAISDRVDSYAILFTGTTDIEALDFWREVDAARSQAGASFEASILDGVTSEQAMAKWVANGWNFTVAETSRTDTDADLAGSVAVSMRPSGLDSVHISDGEGTIESSMTGALTLCEAYRRAGRTVTVTTGLTTWASLPGFNAKTWADLLAMAASTPAAQETAVPTLGAALQNLGRGMCAALYSKEAYDVTEDYVVHALMSPQYFWSRISSNVAGL